MDASPSIDPTPWRPVAPDLEVARETAARELRALDALLASTEGGAPACAALLRAWYAVILFEAAIEGLPPLSQDEFIEGLKAGDAVGWPGPRGRLDAVDPDALLAATVLPALAEPPSPAALLRERGALVAWWKKLREEQTSVRRRMLPRFVGVAGLAFAALVSAALVFARRPPVWRVEYFQTERLVDPIASDLTADVGGHWGPGSPHAAVPADGFSSRWESCIALDGPRVIVFRLGSDDGSRLIVDGRSVIDQWQPQSYAERSGEIALSAGVHTLRVEHFDAHGDATLVLAAQLDREGAFGPIPRSLLRAPRGSPPSCADAAVAAR